MGFVDKTPEGRYRAYFRDPAGKRRIQDFPHEADATAFLAEVENLQEPRNLVSPHAGRLLFGEHARRWMATWNTEATAAAKDRSIMETHVLPRWGDVPLGSIDHLGLQEWITELSTRRKPATVGLVLRLAGAVLRSAVRNRLIASNPGRGRPGPGIRPQRHRRAHHQQAGPSGAAPARRPDRYRASWPPRPEPVCAGAKPSGSAPTPSTSTRTAVGHPHRDRGRRTDVVQAVPQVGRRSAGGAATRLARAHHPAAHAPDGPRASDEPVFANEVGAPLRRTLFRSRIWRPSLVRAGLLGEVAPAAQGVRGAVDRRDRRHSTASGTGRTPKPCNTWHGTRPAGCASTTCATPTRRGSWTTGYRPTWCSG